MIKLFLSKRVKVLLEQEFVHKNIFLNNVQLQ